MPQYYVSSGLTLAIRAGFDNLYAYRITPGDFTGDGKLDFIVTYSLGPIEDRAVPLRVMAGDGLGGFADRTDALFGANLPQNVHPRDLTVGDFNRDGRPDLFVADQGLDGPPFPGGQNTLVLSSGAGGLANATSQLPAQRAFTHSTEAVDIDRDGDLDIFVGAEANPAPYFLINDGTGRFTVASDRLPASVGAPGNIIFTTEAFFDADGDGDRDLFLGAARQNGVNRLLLNDGTGRFSEASAAPPLPAPYTAGSDAIDAQSLDLNGDGREDLVVVYTIGADGARAYTQTLINQGGGVFVDETAQRVPASFQNISLTRGGLILADINGDGAKDLLYADGTAAPLALNDGTGRFIHMPAGTLPGGAGDTYAVGDVNADGRLDLIAWTGRGGGQEFMRISLAGDPGTTQVGTAGADGLMGGGRAETINGLAGNDVIVGGGGRDYIRGDEGDDVLVGGSAFDDINGNMGNDTVSTGAGEDYCVGGKDNDSLSGGADYDLVYGNLGNDTCNGDDGNDIVRGGQDNDLVNGGNGDDFVSGDKGDDTMTGGLGADNFHTFGDAGIDRVTDFSLAQGDRVQLDPGTQYTVSQVGADTVISMTGGGQMILVGVAMSSLTGNWIFGA
ncbi:MAG: VCBS repeat-containing protein [Phenylobacterium sp.]|uniref:FG-GAP-like repeat-containing protein n=1 Tax=Phenylobacterium sp. TaxID=1871053 RepID=UPI001A623D8B|nr:FG-GAP-like repeat-containing protein [Phenylobacterium sp.]MBL8557007.1 VCBS repeat-containing protein [Phenylobacterium sp.]